MTLPSKPQTRAGMPPRRARVLLGASPKVGKTTLFADWAPATSLIVDTHNGTLFLDGEHYVQHVSDWPQFVATVTDVLRGGHRFHTIGLDLVGDLWRFCDLYYGRVKDGLKIPASGMDDYGRSSTKARSAFTGQIGRLLTAPVGVWFLTHLREKTDKEGQLVVYAPDMDKAVHGYVMGAVDFVWLAENDGGRRLVHTQATPHFEAGSRFLLPSPLPMDARAIATAMDRALNPQDYDEKGERKQPEPTPEVVPPTAEPEDVTAPLERKDIPKPDPSKSDVPVDEVWWAAVHTKVKECNGPELRAFLTDKLHVTVPEKVASWKTLLGGLPADKRAGLTLWLQERQDAKAEVPWSGDEKADAAAEATT